MLAGCGEDEKRAQPVRIVTAPPYEGAIPGRRVDLPGAGYVGVVRDTVHEVLAAGTGAERVALLLALDRRDRTLCVGFRQSPGPGYVNVDFRCGVRAPAIVYAGRAGSDVDVVERASLVGAAGPGVRRIEVTYANRDPISPELRPLRGTGLRAFALEPGPLPRSLRAVGDHEDVLAEYALSSIGAAPCAQPAACVGADGPWTDAIDPLAGSG